jgi:hypothetical protein
VSPRTPVYLSRFWATNPFHKLETAVMARPIQVGARVLRSIAVQGIWRLAEDSGKHEDEGASPMMAKRLENILGRRAQPAATDSLLRQAGIPGNE